MASRMFCAASSREGPKLVHPTAGVAVDSRDNLVFTTP
jgi:hypothetical protein